MFDHEVTPLATPTEACREFARNVGHEFPDRPWILTDYDTWERNPFYQGPPARHPEDDQEDEGGIDEEAASASDATIRGQSPF